MWCHALCNPDVTYRKQEMRKHQPDRERQHAYSLPYYNHQIRNISAKYRWIMCDNEPDWGDDCPSGTRPQRQQTHRLPLFGSVFNYINYRYTMDDPMFTTNSYRNMSAMYHKIGYKKLPGYGSEDGDEE